MNQTEKLLEQLRVIKSKQSGLKDENLDKSNKLVKQQNNRDKIKKQLHEHKLVKTCKAINCPPSKKWQLCFDGYKNLYLCKNCLTKYVDIKELEKHNYMRIDKINYL